VVTLTAPEPEETPVEPEPAVEEPTPTVEEIIQEILPQI